MRPDGLSTAQRLRLGGQIGRATIAAAAFGAGFLLFASAGAMAAARPENDKRADAVRLSGVPSRTTGTTVRALAEGTDPAPSCAPIGPTVWYRLPGSNGQTAVVLHALGQLEAVVGVYRIDRSHITGLGCSKTDAKGLAGLAFRARPRKTYLLLVGQREGSIPGKFELVVQKPESGAETSGPPASGGGQLGFRGPVARSRRLLGHRPGRRDDLHDQPRGKLGTMPPVRAVPLHRPRIQRQGAHRGARL